MLFHADWSQVRFKRLKDGEKDESLNLVRETLKDFLVSLLFQWNKRFFVSPIKSELLLWRHRARFRLHSRVSNLTQFSVFLRSRFSVLVARDRPSENEQALNQKLVWLLGVKAWSWRPAGHSRHSPEDAVGLWFSLHTSCWLLLRKQIRLSGLITAGSAAATVNNNALFFCCCVSQCDGLYSNCSVRTSAPRLSSLERGRPAHSAFLCSDTHITASMCVTGCDKQESLHSRLLWKQVNYPRGSRRKKCVGTKAERAPTKWVWSWISFCELRSCGWVKHRRTVLVLAGF